MILADLHKNFKKKNSNFRIDFFHQFREDGISALFGPSGSGKTTVLRMLAGLTHPDAGKIIFNGNTWYNGEARIHKAIQQRETGFVFQDGALFPNMTVRENIEFAGGGKKFTEELLEILELGRIATNKPYEISGGQIKRTALGRAVASRPQLLLLDEPFSGLDHRIRLKLHRYLSDLRERFSFKTILVTHELSDVFSLCNEVVKMENGKIIKSGVPSIVFGNHELSGKFTSAAEITKLEISDIVVVATLVSGEHVFRAVLTSEESESLKVGDKVMLSSKAFNPLVKKADE